MKSHKMVTAVVVLIIVLGKNVIYTVLDQKHFSGSDRPVNSNHQHFCKNQNLSKILGLMERHSHAL